MNFRRHRRRETPGLDLTPLIDVVFLLLIFFMVSTTFVHESRLRIDLPEATDTATETVVQPIEITIDARAAYAINGQAVRRGDTVGLRRALAAALADPAYSAAAAGEGVRVVITADANTPHQAVVRAMDVVGQLGISSLGITTREPDDSR